MTLYVCQACHKIWTPSEVPEECDNCGSRQISPKEHAETELETYYAAPRAEAPSIHRRSVAFPTLYWLGVVMFVVGVLLAGALGEDEEPAPVGLAVMALGIASLFSAVILGWVKLYQVWSLVQPRNRAELTENSIATPGSAVGFLFIPFYNLYWKFVAYHGLAQRVNNLIPVRSLSMAPMNAGLALTYCILSLCGIIPFLGVLVVPINVVLYFLLILDVDRARVELLAENTVVLEPIGTID